MKNSYKWVPIFLMVALVSCYRDDFINQEEEPTTDPLTKARQILERDEVVKMLPAPEKMFKVSSEKAVEIALEYSSLFGDQERTMENLYLVSAQSASKAVSSVTSIVDNTEPTATRALNAVSSKPDTLMHIVNFAGEEGFAIISTDSRNDAVIAYSDSGNFNMEDTVGNPAMKYHVDMIMSYVRHKKEERRQQIENEGLDYFGDMELTSIDESGIKTFAAGVPGMPGEPGGGKPGMPGLPEAPQSETGCMGDGYIISRWDGSQKAIEYVQRYHGNSRCFGTPKGTPPLHVVTNKNIYNAPPISSIDEYYLYYGCYLTTYKPTIKTIESQYGPYCKTAWTVGRPLNKYCKDYTYDIGCAPLALLQIFAYYDSPRTFFYTAHGNCDLHATKLGSARNYRTNADLETKMDSLWRVALFARQIGKAVGVTYLPGATAATGLKKGSKCIQDALSEFDYTFDEEKDFRNASNLKYVKESLMQGKPVFIFGYPISENGKGIPLYNKLHAWVIHGYKTVRTRTWTDYFYFDERGGLNKIVNANTNGVSQYYCFNMGWGPGSHMVWMLGDTYTWQGHRYDRITFLAGIEPIHPPE